MFHIVLSGRAQSRPIKIKLEEIFAFADMEKNTYEKKHTRTLYRK